MDSELQKEAQAAPRLHNWLLTTPTAVAHIRGADQEHSKAPNCEEKQQKQIWFHRLPSFAAQNSGTRVLLAERLMVGKFAVYILTGFWLEPEIMVLCS